LKIQRSLHGPIVSQAGETAIALRVAGLDRPGIMQQWWDMGQATNLAQFEAALKQMQIPMFTVLYADRKGHILHFFNGQVPVRSQGDFEDWTQLLPGDTSRNLWTKTHAYQDLPRIVDPASGWLQNANDAPWTTTFPTAIDPEDYPAYIAPRGPMSFRAQRSAQMLLNDDKISFEEVVQYKHSTEMFLADRLLDDLLPLARQGSERSQKAAAVLAKWDRQTNADSRGAVLFSTWADNLDLEELFAKPWDAKTPLSTPDGLAHPQAAIAALETAAAKVEKNYGALDVSWGEVYRFQSGTAELPANGGPAELGVFRTLWFQPTDDHHFRAVGGDSYVAVVEFSNPVRAQVLMTYGNSTQPNSPHNGDQLQLAAQQKLRPAWRSRSEIETHLAQREQL
ncbi:MAG TPA: penicillin acylase family protein, partial [Candidatus Obscuribacterales bacterium]